MKILTITGLVSVALATATLPSAGQAPRIAAVAEDEATSRELRASVARPRVYLPALLSYNEGRVRLVAAGSTMFASAAVPSVVKPPARLRTGAAVRASRSARTTRVVRRVVTPRASRSTGSAVVPSGGRRTTIASWYGERPAACYDARGRHRFPSGLSMWTAHRTLPCGTIVEIVGPAGVIRVPVYDRGPYVGGRSLDLSVAAFRAACGSTSKGVCRVAYGVV